VTGWVSGLLPSSCAWLSEQVAKRRARVMLRQARFKMFSRVLVMARQLYVKNGCCI